MGRLNSTDSQKVSRREEGQAHTFDPILGRRLVRRDRKGRAAAAAAAAAAAGGTERERVGDGRKEERGKITR